MSTPVSTTPDTVSQQSDPAPSPFDVEALRADFPILNQKVPARSLVYLDNSATTQKPQPVIDYLNRYYAMQNSNIHRGVYQLSEIATEADECARH